MYFAFLRGRQYELIALRELIAKKLLSKNITPIIEPVNLTATLLSTMEAFIKAKTPLAVIANPIVGAFYKDCSAVKPGSKEEAQKDRFFELYKSNFIIKSVYVNDTASSFIKLWKDAGIETNEILVVLNNPNKLDLYNKLFPTSTPKYILMPNEPSFKKKTSINRVLLYDRFNKQSKNADYVGIDDEYFSEDCFLCIEDGFIGFSDYSIVGEAYDSKGFAPKAVAIHIVYISKKPELRVAHFVSSSNDDVKNPAKKFYEAVSELAKWYNKNPEIVPLTYGFTQFLEHYKKQSYPALGPVKKLSIMHHLELLGKYLDEK